MADEKTPQPTDLMVIKRSEAQAIIDYLAKCPCGDVYALVTTLLNLQPLVEKEVEVPDA